MVNDLHKFLRSRRSIRHFRPEPVPRDMIKRVLETAICAPSAHNLQPWRFAVLIGAEAKKHLADHLTIKFRQDMTADGIPEAEIQARITQTIRRTEEAPVIIVLCREVTRIKSQPDGERQAIETLMGTQSVALAGLQLLLAAHAEGLGGTWICWPLFAPEETRLALALGIEWEPQGMVFLGFPAESPEMAVRTTLHEVTKYI